MESTRAVKHLYFLIRHRLQVRPLYPKQRLLLRNNENGSIIVEAALLLPMVLLLFLFFIYMIQAAVISTALQSAATNSVKQVATHMYPVALAAEAIPPVWETGPIGRIMSKPPIANAQLLITEFVNTFGVSLPEPVSSWVVSGKDWVGNQVHSLGEQLQAPAGQAIFQPLLARYGIQHVLVADRIRVTHLKLPDLKGKQSPFISLQIEYDLPMRVPFTMEKVTLTARASERVWVGDGPPPNSNNGQAGSSKDKPPPQLGTLSPQPLHPGGKASLNAKVEPNERVELVVYWKSGKSEAKHVGWAEADANGNISWTWHISGNTQPGTWKLEVRTADGRSSTMMFDVEKKMK
ncbi:pilus assembly protein [Paenibacillus arenosi]|uniref:Pilus assembly protein n=1 Tax=Paenibacillus arenosi TaxID=2774142 RepID=A0ABR9B110_9BACL|nr:pilus assembly protein [Paenibacillus arenosi]MBD8500013.1 pilus assembly protein [Paenibacillus arenosi]